MQLNSAAPTLRISLRSVLHLRLLKHRHRQELDNPELDAAFRYCRTGNSPAIPSAVQRPTSSLSDTDPHA